MALFVQRRWGLLLGLLAIHTMVCWCEAEEWLQLDSSRQYDIYHLNKMAPLNIADVAFELLGLDLGEFNRDFPEVPEYGSTLKKDSKDSIYSEDSKDSEDSGDSEGSGDSKDLKDSENSKDSKDSKDSEDSMGSESSGDSKNSEASEGSEHSRVSKETKGSGDLEDLKYSKSSKDPEGPGDAEDSKESKELMNSEELKHFGKSEDMEGSGYSEDSNDSENRNDSGDSENLDGSEITKDSEDSEDSKDSKFLEDSKGLGISEDSKDSEDSEDSEKPKDSEDWKDAKNSEDAKGSEDSTDSECEGLSCYARQTGSEVREAPQVVRSPPCSPAFPLVPVYPDFTVYFTSPNYPDPFPPIMQCGWTFWSPEGTLLRLLCTPVTLGIRDYLLVKDFTDGGRVFGVTNQNGGVVRSQFIGNTARVGLLAYGVGMPGCFRCWMSAITDTTSTTPSASTPVTTPPTPSRPAITAAAATKPPPTSTAKPLPDLPSPFAAAGALQNGPKIPSTPLCQCGRAAIPRIAGGMEASEYTHPWVVALAYPVNTGQLSVFCGGSLISSHFVLTAAHCVRAIQTFRRPEIHLLLGLHSLDRIGGPGMLDERPLEYIVHPAFNNKTLDSDLGLIRIAPLDLSRLPDTIRPVCLPARGGKVYEGVDGVVAGWGSLGTGAESPRVLLEVSLPILPQSQCRSLLGNVVTDNMQCAGLLAGGKDSCQGDSGGPLVVTDGLSGTMELAGVVSWGYGCAQARKPGVYVRVSQFLPWLVQATAGSITCERN